MTFRVRVDPVALRQIDEFVAYLRDYSEDLAIEQIERLDRILRLIPKCVVTHTLSTSWPGLSRPSTSLIRFVN